jgi:predicted ArsR family transcriptional regulator
MILSMARRLPEPESREATTAEFKALAHPLRLRILRLCVVDAMTNKQIADRLELDPATTLYHVRTLLRTGFIGQEPVRTGTRGALEKPYRATDKSWALAIPRSGDRLTTILAGIDALRAELHAAGPESLISSTLLGLQLTEDEIEELRQRIVDTVNEYVQRAPNPNGTQIGLFSILHRLH